MGGVTAQAGRPPAQARPLMGCRAQAVRVVGWVRQQPPAGTPPHLAADHPPSALEPPLEALTSPRALARLLQGRWGRRGRADCAAGQQFQRPTGSCGLGCCGEAALERGGSPSQGGGRGSACRPSLPRGAVGPRTGCFQGCGSRRTSRPCVAAVAAGGLTPRCRRRGCTSYGTTGTATMTKTCSRAGDTHTGMSLVAWMLNVVLCCALLHI